VQVPRLEDVRLPAAVIGEPKRRRCPWRKAMRPGCLLKPAPLTSVCGRLSNFEHAPEAAADGIEPVPTRGTRTSSQADIRRPHKLGPSSRLSEVLVEYLKQARTKDGDGEPKMMWA
jgi:hypothetical protein